MKQKYAVVVLFALIIASSMVSLTSYKRAEKLVTEDVNQALAKALDEQPDVISADTIQVFNSHLQIEVTIPPTGRSATPPLLRKGKG